MVVQDSDAHLALPRFPLLLAFSNSSLMKATNHNNGFMSYIRRLHTLLQIQWVLSETMGCNVNCVLILRDNYRKSCSLFGRDPGESKLVVVSLFPCSNCHFNVGAIFHIRTYF
jgi:hypothetical protein